jgi:DNA-binding response OmpR family regulator
MLHTFFRLMELDCSLVAPDPDAVSNIRRLAPDVLIVDLDLPDLRALEIARESRKARAGLPVIFLTDRHDAGVEDLGRTAIVARPRDSFEDLLRLLEVVLAFER